MKNPILVIMAAGMGSRYGGLKQLDTIDEQGHVIVDYSIYDAYRAGFRKVVFIIREHNYELFKEKIGNRVAKYMQVEYVFQELEKLPCGYTVPEGREKPFGTGHAVLCCKDIADAPFVVINADDFYGEGAFKSMYDFLCSASDDEKYRFAMVGYCLKNTLTENGYVSRGVCTMDNENMLKTVTERTKIAKCDGVTAYVDQDGGSVEIDENLVVSMNFWGFSTAMIKELEHRFIKFLDNEIPVNPLKAEYFLPFVVNELISEDRASVKVITTDEKWYGITYREDKESIVKAVEKMKKDGKYPENLWK